MKLISKSGKKVLKMTKAEWDLIGKQYKWSGTVPNTEKVKQIIDTLSQLSQDIEGLAQQTSGYKFMTEQKQVMELNKTMDRFLRIIEKNKSNVESVKTAQTLEVVKTPEKFTDREITRAIRDAIIAEEGAINQYETIVDATDNELVKKVLQEIADEERVHVGELQTLLNGLLKDEEILLEEGKQEVIEKK